jgi:hypothetical protein
MSLRAVARLALWLALMLLAMALYALTARRR